MRFNFPLFLTWLRIVAIPVFVAVLYVPESWITERNANIISMWIFIAAAVTDWLDGYLARRWNQTTSFGAFLDPVADKLMVAAALIVLTEKGIVDPFASLIIIGREITISALREWMATIGQSRSVAVNVFGKVKTIDDFLSNYKLFSYAMKAYGLEDMAYAKGLMRKVLEGGITASKSLANTFTASVSADGASWTAVASVISPSPRTQPLVSSSARTTRRRSGPRRSTTSRSRRVRRPTPLPVPRTTATSVRRRRAGPSRCVLGRPRRLLQLP